MTRFKQKAILWLLLVSFGTPPMCRSLEYDFTQCHKVEPSCTCKHVSGKNVADCMGKNLKDIPELRSTDIQELKLDDNSIGVLKKNIFLDVGLKNLQKLSLKKCKIYDIDKRAFSELRILIFIDLSDNLIRRLDPTTFVPTIKLRNIFLNNNQLQRVDDELFANLDQLQRVELENNQISVIRRRAFHNLPAFVALNLNNNQLSYLNESCFEKLPGLNSLELRDNPWRCDCHLRRFIDSLEARKSKVSLSQPIYCQEPESMRNKTWSESREFACVPSIVWPASEDAVKASGDEWTLSCQVIGDPKPETYWTFNSKTLTNSTLVASTTYERKYINYVSGDTVLWNNVTITKFSSQDRGEYTCVAKNAAGIVEKKITVSQASGGGLLFYGSSDAKDTWILLLCIIIGIICALVIVFMLCFVCCRRAETLAAKKPPSNSITANGSVTHHIVGVEPEQQKTLLTAVNPVQKPPRKYDSSPQSENGGTELTELNRNLLDDASVQAGTSVAGDSMDDRRSTNSLDQLSCHSQDNLLLQQDRTRIVRSHHPPDLLAFSSRRMQASPANSTVSNDADSSRLRLLHSPVRSPIYQMHAYSPSYDTLPYGRSHSPFSGGSGLPIIAHRQGYVTIPRRPRVPSWSSAPTPTIEEALCKTEPVYDNLGPRTTIDGSSATSLPRRVAAESPGMRTRPLPLAPLYTSHTLPHKAKLNHVFLSIRENDEQQYHSPKENGGVIRPLPLQYSPSGELKPTPLPPSSTIDRKKGSNNLAARHTPETGVLRRAPKETSPSPKSTASTLPIPKQKVPPQPPPKPKKNGPLFEDEGEDGTEV